MNIDNAIKQLNNLINRDLSPISNNWNMKYDHSNFIQKIISEMNNTLNAALRYSNNSRYKVDFNDSGNRWELDIKEGGGLSFSYSVSFWIEYEIVDDNELYFTLSKYQLSYSDGRDASGHRLLNNETYHIITYNYYLNDGKKISSIDLKVGAKPADAKQVFSYLNEKPIH